MKHCSGKTDDALHGTGLLVFRMPGCLAGCSPGKIQPSRDLSSCCIVVSHQHVQPFLHSAGFAVQERLGKAGVAAEGFGGCGCSWGLLPASLEASSTLP